MRTILSCLALCTAFTAPAIAADLDPRFTGIEAPTGAIMAVVFASEADCTAGKPTRAPMIPAKALDAKQMVAGLAPGFYTTKAFYGIDGDGQMGATRSASRPNPLLFRTTPPPT